MKQTSGPQVSGRLREAVLLVDKGVYHFSAHWLAFLNILLVLFMLPFFLAPYLMSTGHERAGRFLYAVYGTSCHQLPERSFYLFGERLTYSWEELIGAGVDPASFPYERRHFLGSPELGYKTAVCERDVATYAGLLLCGIAFGLLRRRLKPLPLWALALCIVPLGIDGVSQLVGLRESTPALRAATGFLASAAGIWFAYPHVERAMLDLRRQTAAKLGVKP